jgi:hypothetical protein
MIGALVVEGITTGTLGAGALGGVDCVVGEGAGVDTRGGLAF